ncbi:MAG: uridine phosphorylase [Crenarchaeota archaeon]|nr:uridine phosphorylase [Thermoproteota archaeon]MCR8454804.1 uridine phosphorylase [Thermoproteota archaeon]
MQLADKPILDGKLYHIAIAPNELPRYILVPGDPQRTEIIANMWDEKEELAYYRQYRSFRGKYKNAPIGTVSTGIGGPATEICIIELLYAGADTFIRVGSTGALVKDIELGDLIINYAAVRLDGASRAYAPPEFPAVASLDVTLALIKAAEALGYRYHVGIAASTDSFYAGQERPINGWLPDNQRGLIERLKRLRVINFEMECATLFTIASIFGARAGSVCAVYANRETGDFSKKGESEACKVACEAVRILYEWDEERNRLRKGTFWIPELFK